MTKKHFKQLADVLRVTGNRLAIHSNGQYNREIHEALVDMIASICKNDNARFDYERFREACGIVEKE